MSNLNRSPADWLIAGGALGDLIRRKDWSGTPLGHRADWPVALRNAINIIVNAHSPMAIVWGRDDTLLYNDAYIPVAGIKHPGALGSSTRDSWVEVWPEVEPVFSAVIDRGEAFFQDQKHYRINRRGEPEDAYFSIGFSPLWLEDGTVGGTLVVLEETTAEIVRQRQILEDYERTADVFEHGDACFVLDPEFRIVLVNRMQETLSATRRQDTLGRSFWDVFPEAARPESKFWQVYNRVMKDRVAVEFEEYYEPLDLWTDLRAYPTREGGIAVFFHDATSRKRAEDELRRTRERFQLIVEHQTDMVALMARDGRRLYVNPRFLEAVGKSEEEVLSTHYSPEIHPEDIDRVAREWQKTFEPPAFRSEIVARTHTGTGWRWFSWRNTGLPDETGAADTAISVGRDITDLKQSEEVLRQANEELAAAKVSAETAKAVAEEASRAKDEFLAILSHELRTPLTPVTAWLSLLQQRSDLSTDVRDKLQAIKRNVELEAQLIDDLLDVTRIERGKVELAKEPLNLGDVIERAVEVCRPDIEARRVHFGVDLGCAGSLVVSADPIRLQQVFWNLLKNAIKFTPHGGCIGLGCQREEDRVIVQVTDSGVGIDPKDLDRVFGAFEQAGRRSNGFGGLGLGLAITKRMVQLHGGAITAHSAGPGQGATFRVSLPLLREVRPHERSPSHREPVQSSDSPALSILLVEDHGDSADSMRELLSLWNHDVTIAGDVATGLDEAARRHFDVVVSDLGLPDGSGHDLVRQLRARGIRTPAIALSGYGREADIAMSRAAGFRDHLVKPVDPLKLKVVVERAAERGPDAAGAERPR